MIEKRKYKRRHLIYYLEVLEQGTDISIGFVVDVTQNGILVMSSMPLAVGRIFHLKMLVDEDRNDKSFLHFEARSKWCNKSPNSDFYDTGFELINLDASAFNKISEIIEELGFKG